MRVRFYATLRPLVGAREVEVALPPGTSARRLVAELVRRWPALGQAILDERGELVRHVQVFLDGRSTRHLPAGLETSIAADAEVDVFPAVAGG